MPSRWQGEWHRHMLGQSPASYADENGTRYTVVDPYQLWTIVDTIVQAGHLLRVTWSQQDMGDPNGGVNGSPIPPDPNQQGKVVREGRIIEASFTPDRMQDIAWELSFDWKSRGSGQQKTAPVRDDSLVARAAQMQSAANQMLANLQNKSWLQSNAAIPNSAGTLQLGQLERMARAPLAIVNNASRLVQQNVDNLARVVGVARTVATMPISVAGQAVNIALNTVDACNAMIDTLTQTPPELYTLQGSTADLCRSSKFYADTRSDFADIGEAAWEAAVAVQLRRSVVGLQGKPGQREVKMGASDVLAVHVARPGDTPARVSLRYYGSPDHGPDILRANKLPLYQVQLPIGRPFIIPVLAVTQVGT
jgi:hypothetical protein